MVSRQAGYWFCQEIVSEWDASMRLRIRDMGPQHKLPKTSGIIQALCSPHAIAYAFLGRGHVVLVTIWQNQHSGNRKSQIKFPSPRGCGRARNRGNRTSQEPAI